MNRVNVNGASRSLADVSVHTNALDFLRGLGLTGAKEGCAEGECGACSVLVARPDPDGSAATEWTAVNACLVPAAALAGQEVVTSEGLGCPENLHTVQRELAERGGSQCGYCTPGFVCSMAAEFYRAGRGRCSDSAAADEHHGPNGFDLHAIGGNLCRCTGYRPIRDAAFALAEPEADDALAVRRGAKPPEVRSVELRDSEATYIRPESLSEALGLLGESDAVVVAGSTDWGVEVNVRGRRATTLVAVDRLPELRGFAVSETEIRIGAGLTLTEVEQRLGGRVPLLAGLMPQFASRLIRNSATLGGNLGTGSPIGDSPPVLLALEASVVLSSTEGERAVPLSEYFTGYRASVRGPDELIREIIVPLPLSQIAAFHKIAKRPFDDISSVAVAFAIDVADGVVRKARIGLGGVAATPIRAFDAEAALKGRPWNPATVEAAALVLAGEGTPLSDQRSSAAYRSAMLGQAIRKLHAQDVAS